MKRFRMRYNCYEVRFVKSCLIPFNADEYLYYLRPLVVRKSKWIQSRDGKGSLADP